MKRLTHKEFLEAPSRVQFIYTMSMVNQPISTSMLDDAISEHPEYFPDEVEHRSKWALIPQEVHDEYWKEREKLRAEIYKEMPPSKGILDWINDPKGYKEFSIAYEKCRNAEKLLASALHKKFYGQYGIEWDGI